MMQDREDFFSPEQVDERLDFSLHRREAEAGNQGAVGTDPNLLLVHDLCYLYGAEGTENVRSLQRVWERLAERRADTRLSPKAGQHLRLLKPHEEAMSREVRRRSRRVSGRGLAVLAAVLFLVIMLGSLFTLIHLTRTAQTASTSTAVSTPARQVTPAQATPVPGYPYPAPGKSIAVSPTSPGDFYALTWSQDSKQVAASTQGKVEIWGANAGGQLLTFDPGAGHILVSLAWSPGAPLLAVGSSLAQVIDPANGSVLFYYPALPGYSAPTTGDGAALVTAVAWSPDGTRLAVATRDSPSDNAVRIWNVQSGALLYTFSSQNTGGTISSISWSDDGRYIASANEQSVQAWDVINGGVIFARTISGSTNVAWSPSASDAGLLAFVSNTATQIWNVWTNKMISNYPGTANGVLSWAPDGNYLATASGSDVIIEDVASGTRLYTYTGNVHYVSSLAWSPDGSSLVSGESSASGYNVARVWSA